MDQISKLNAALVSVPQELTVAAANFNLDFSLMKVEAPKEFLGVGDSLSAHRRGEAEEGQSHVTARKLGALFESLVPPVPHLYRAYGKRASEISSRSKSKWSDGFESKLFAPQAGPDGTSIWAAATSGRGAIAVHLLACMLARIWKSHEAISLWVELVERRKQEILDKYDNTNAIEIASLMASKQTFSRQQLSTWDASARSWLQTADADRKLQQTQLMLIISNVRLPVNSKKDPYESVVDAWTSGMVAMDRLAQGIPQRVQDGTILLAMSSWHLYPDMEVLLQDVKHIEQHDKLMRNSLITISSQGLSQNKEGVFWSLPLARLRYYSAPVISERHIASSNSRVTIHEFWLIALGAIISQWGPSCVNTDKGTGFIIQLSKLVNEPRVTVRWLKHLADAAQRLSIGTELDRLQSNKLLRLGLRSRRDILNDTNNSPYPFFGLSKYPTLLALLSETEAKISMLREIGLSLGISHDRLLIQYSSDEHAQKRQHDASSIFATVTPPVGSQLEVSSDHGNVPRPKRRRVETPTGPVRWIVQPEADTAHMIGGCGEDCFCLSSDVDLTHFCPCMVSGGNCTSSCHADAPEDTLCPFEFLSRSAVPPADLSCDGNSCGCVIPGGPYCPCEEASSNCSMFCHFNKDGLCACNSTENMLDTLREKASMVDCCSIDNPCRDCLLIHLCQRMKDGKERCVFLRPNEVLRVDDWSFTFESHHADEPVYQLLLGDIYSVGLYAHASNSMKREAGILSTSPYGSDADLEQIQKFMFSRSMELGRLRQLLNSNWGQESGESSTQQRASLEALVFATDVYNNLQGASVSVEATNIPLYMAKWAQEIALFDRGISIWRAEGFSPIDMDEMEFQDFKEINTFSEFKPDMYHFNFLRLTKHDVADPAVSKGDSPVQTFGNEELKASATKNQASIDIPTMKTPQMNHRLALSFACIAMMETGEFDIDPERLSGVVAMSSGDSIFVSSDMISDPYDNEQNRGICRVFGNLGRSEVAFLLPPSQPTLKGFDINSWHLVNHFQFDGNFENKFEATSLHLSFTDFEMPVDVGARGLRDTLVILLESVVSVNDGGEHIGDLDINSMFGNDSVFMAPKCTHDTAQSGTNGQTFIAIDSWAEFWELPETTGIFRADGNWQARLAATAASLQLGKRVVILPPKPCVQCLEAIDTSRFDLIIA